MRVSQDGSCRTKRILRKRTAPRQSKARMRSGFAAAVPGADVQPRTHSRPSPRVEREAFSTRCATHQFHVPGSLATSKLLSQQFAGTVQTHGDIVFSNT